MKAKIVRDECDDGSIERLWIAEADNLAITPELFEVFAHTGFEIDGDCEILGEVEVPDEFVNKALAYIKAKDELDSLCDQLDSLIN